MSFLDSLSKEEKKKLLPFIRQGRKLAQSLPKREQYTPAQLMAVIAGAVLECGHIPADDTIDKMQYLELHGA